MTNSSLDNRCINAIRFLSIDAIKKANSGHPGIAMGAAPAAFVLWNRFLKFNPKNPSWFNRDRFILSAGHGSMLQYSLLHLTGFDSVTIEDIKNFRQLNSRTPGHPENRETKGVEVTTGPLGQGVANAVGMAMAERHLAARFNKPDCELIDHYTYTLLGDGCQMEGISSEACSFAGHLGLGKLIAIYDDNSICIDGPTDLTFTEDVGKRFEAYGWQVLTVENGDTDLEGIEKAIKEAQAETGKPSLIMVQTTIGYGAPNKGGSSDMHGAPLGPDEIEATRKNLGWEEPPFVIPDEVLQQMRKEEERAALETEWNDILGQYKEKYPEDAKALVQLMDGVLPGGWQALLPTFSSDDKPEATRGLSGKCLNAVAETVTGLIGGSADLSPSTKTVLACSGRFQKDAFENRNIHFGVREHGMGGICNGIALHNPGLIPYCATFLTFTDYMRGSIRVAALSGAPVIYVMTHDSIAVGEDGPTHQPVEHLAAMRTIPNLTVLRPADGNETSGAYKIAIENRKGPTLIALSRQKLPQLAGTSMDSVSKGAYVLSGGEGDPDIILIGTGGELSLCVQAAGELKKDGVNARVVSMPSFELFDRQDEAYKESVLPKAVTKRLAVEAGTDFGWQRYVGLDGATVSVDGFGTSAPGGVCLEKYGYTVENVVDRARKLLS